MEDFPINHDVHPRAKATLTHQFYWDQNNPTGPFSQNRVSDTFGEFAEWRDGHKYEPVIDFLPEYTLGGFVFDRNETDIEKIKEFYSIHYEFHRQANAQFGDALFSGLMESMQSLGITHINLPSDEQRNDILEQTARNMGYTALKEQDDQIISAGFGQFILEGTIDPDLKELTRKALIRQLHPFVLDTCADESKDARRVELGLMLNDLELI